MGLDEDRVLHVRVLQPGWRDQFGQMRTMLTEELRRIAGVKLQAIHFEGQGSTRGRGAAGAGAKGSAGGPAAAPPKERRKGQRRSS
jgi:hypothetical protein